MSCHRAVHSMVFAVSLGLAICLFDAAATAQPSGTDGDLSKNIDSGESPANPIGFRSVGLGFTPHLSAELDLYVHPDWAVGVGLSHGGGDEFDCNFDRCWHITSAQSYAERYVFLGDRWAHIGLRGGLFAADFYAQSYAFGRDGREITRRGSVFGPSLGATLYVTAFHWGALTLNLTGMPGIFHGRERDGWPNASLPEDADRHWRQTTHFVFTGVASFGVRFGDLDGRDPRMTSSTSNQNTRRTSDTPEAY